MHIILAKHCEMTVFNRNFNLKVEGERLGKFYKFVSITVSMQMILAK